MNRIERTSLNKSGMLPSTMIKGVRGPAQFIDKVLRNYWPRLEPDRLESFLLLNFPALRDHR